MNSRGLGDSIEKITEATGIKKIVHNIFGDECGCEARKELLNRIFPYKFECLTEDEFKSLENFDWRDDRITMEDKIILLKIYNRVFNQNFGMTTCNSCWVKYISDLKKLYNVYKDEKNN